MVDQKRRPVALNLTPPPPPPPDPSASIASTTVNHSDFSSSSSSKPKPPPLLLRTPRFAEATSVNSPIDHHHHHHRPSPFADPAANQVHDVGFGYIHPGPEARIDKPSRNALSSSSSSSSSTLSSSSPPQPKSPLKSAIKMPGTPARHLSNPLSPTFRQEDLLEKREACTDVEQARDLKIKTRVRMAKFALRGVNFSCSLIILAMISSSFAIFNTTKQLPSQSRMPSWAQNTKTWPQKLVLAMSCLSLAACILVFLAYCRPGGGGRGGHRRADKVSTYYTLFAIGWFITSMLLWVITAALFQNARNTSDNKDMWGWSCVDNTRAHVFQDKVDYALVCRLQNWSLICILIEVVVEVICITLYSVVFYRYYTKRRLAKSMDLRDRARSDLYLAQLRSMSAPNTPAGPGRGAQPLSPGGGRPFAQNQQDHHHHYSQPPPAFKLQPPPAKAPPATPKSAGSQTVLVTSASSSLSPNSPSFSMPDMTMPVTMLSPPPPPTLAPSTPSSPPPPPSPPEPQHAPKPADEPVYDDVPIPDAYGSSLRR